MQFKDELLIDIENAREFREHKAEEYPDDARNQQAAKALEGLIEYLSGLPDDHRLFEAYRRVYQESPDDAPIKIMKEVLGRVPGETDIFARYGFGDNPDHAEFVENLADDLIQSWAEHGFDMRAVPTSTH